MSPINQSSRAGLKRARVHMYAVACYRRRPMRPLSGSAEIRSSGKLKLGFDNGDPPSTSSPGPTGERFIATRDNHAT